jgi:pheromone shutdown-related protein TraB
MTQLDNLDRLPSLPVLDKTLLPKSVEVFKCRERGNSEGIEQTVYVVGTAHISKASCDDVRAVIRAVRPQVVMLELCPERRHILVQTEATKSPPLREVVTAWRAGDSTLLQIMLGLLMQRLGSALEAAPGEEFRVALEEAQQVGARVSLGDRNLSITLARTWAALSRWQKARLMWDVLRSSMYVDRDSLLKEVEAARKETDALTLMIEEVGKEFPTILQTLIRERDQYMVYQLHKLASKATRIVAVVGAGHLAGMRKHWTAEIDVQSLLTVPEPAKRRIRWGQLTLFTAGITAAVYCAHRSKGLTLT